MRFKNSAWESSTRSVACRLRNADALPLMLPTRVVTCAYQVINKHNRTFISDPGITYFSLKKLKAGNNLQIIKSIKTMECKLIYQKATLNTYNCS